METMRTIRITSRARRLLRVLAGFDNRSVMEEIEWLAETDLKDRGVTVPDEPDSEDDDDTPATA